MNSAYERSRKAHLFKWPERVYVWLFGIPEIGLRLRALHFRHMLRRIPRRPSRVLDAGCGIGLYTLLLARRYPEATIVGCDLEPASIAVCSQLKDNLHLGNVRFVTADITGPPDFGDPFDLIVCVDVLEHVGAFDSALRGFRRLISDDGYLYIHVPQNNQRRIFRRFANWTHVGHVREGFAPTELANSLAQAGFTPVAIRPTMGAFGKFAWELNHLTLARSVLVAGLIFPVLLGIALFDLVTRNRAGLGVAVLARRTSAETAVLGSTTRVDVSDVL